MKKLLLLILLLGLNACSLNQFREHTFILEHNYKEVKALGRIKKPDGTLVIADLVDVHDHYAMYPRGSMGINDLIIKNIRYPKEAIELGFQGRVIVQYTVAKNGSIKNINVVKSVHPMLDGEAVRVIEQMERWVPARVNGRKVNIIYTQPFTFQF